MSLLLYLKNLKRYFWPYSYLNQSRQELASKYYVADNSANLSKVKRGVVICFDGHIMNGGAADRLRGIVSVYSWCKKHSVPFYINYTTPMGLDNWLLPNIVQWKLADEELSYNKAVSIPYNMIGWMNLEELHGMLSLLHQLHPNKQLHVYANCNPRKEEFYPLFNELFHIEPSLTKQLDDIQTQLFGDTPYVAMSFRFNQLLGDFKDTIGKPLDAEGQETLMRKCITEVDRLHKQNHPNIKVLVTADSTKFVERIGAELDYVATIPGKSVHIDQMKNEAKEAYTKVFVDMLMLSRAQKVYLLRTGKMYRGAFGEYASLIGQIPYEVDEF